MEFIMKLPRFDPTWSVDVKSCYLYDVKEYFGGDAPGSRTPFPDYYFRFRNRFTQIVDEIEKYLPIGSSIIDIAAAQGNFSLFLAERGYKVTWNDLRSDLEGYVRSKYEYGDISYAAGNLLDIENEHIGRYDGVIATELLEHVAHPDEFLISLTRLVRPGGYLFISTPNGRYFRNRLPKFSEYSNPADFEAVQFRPDGDGHIFLLYPDEITVLAERAGIDICELKLGSNTLTTGEFKSKYLLKCLPVRVVDFIENVTRRLPEPFRSKMLNSMVFVLQKPR
ncbi:methyltransferase domain-containing protein [Ancylobacter sp. MQZ15Z-1]|uniref:Methyltransferase domain-containing protein n=1 Tax=Ancylobacter mangrovi TaxID=2972472 RepID=A0A9X2T328_9HYPH|nr:methyltransferase domain-containing protein [Ancylobacter mangrovi]MCS0496880.1 methyltransferase domain-containing protein [Ancylobacter mangrovi]